MIQIHSLAFGPFVEVEPLNRGFFPGHVKLRITVDAETDAGVPDERLLAILAEAFPGLARHECRVEGDPAAAAPRRAAIALLDSDSSANQAHLLEHLTLEILSALDRAPRLSGVTCAYVSPPARSDVFVECGDPETGGFAALLAVEAMNAALAGRPVRPLYPDVVACAAALRARRRSAWPAARVARLAGVPRPRAEAALELLVEARLAAPEEYALNLSGEPHYRFLGMSGPGGTAD